MKLKLYGAIIGLLVGAFSRRGTADGAELYSAYTVQDGRVAHMIMSDNSTPDDMFDDWVVDWEYADT